MSSTEILVLIISIVCPISSLLVAMLSFRRNVRNDTKADSQEKGVLLTEVGYIKSGVDRIEKKMEQLDVKQEEQGKAIAALEAKLEAHLHDRNAHSYKGEKV